MNFWEIVKNIGVLLSLIVTGSAIITMIVKPLRQKFFNAIKTHSNTEGTNKELQTINKSIGEVKSTIDNLHSHDKEKREEMGSMREAMKCMLRSEILHIYYRYLPDGEIPAYQFENLTNLYYAYIALGGNSFIQTIYKIISEEWTIIPNH